MIKANKLASKSKASPTQLLVANRYVVGKKIANGALFKQTIRSLKATATFHKLFAWNEVLLFWFTNYLYSRKCEKNAKQNGLIYFEFW